MYTSEDLKEMKSWGLDRKIQLAQTRIIEWYEKWNGNVYVSFSGGGQIALFYYIWLDRFIQM